MPSRAYAMLVFNLHQKQQLEALVRDKAPPKQLELIQAGFEYEGELRTIQDTFLEDFDVARLRALGLSASRAWALMTKHIDKLEQVQALLREELNRLYSQQRQAAKHAASAVERMLAALALAQGSADGDGEASTQLHTDGAAADGAAGRAQGAKRAWPKVHAIGEAAAAIRELPAEALKREVERRLDTLLIEAGGESLLPLLPPSRGSSAVPSPIKSSRRRKTQELSAASHGLLGGATPSGGGGGGGVSTTAAAGATTVEEPPPADDDDAAAAAADDDDDDAERCGVAPQQQLRSGEIGDETLQATCDLVPLELRIASSSSGASGVSPPAPRASPTSRVSRAPSGRAGRRQGGGAVTGGDVVVKFAHGSHGINDWQREVLALAGLRRNVVRCVGVVEPPSFGTVLEYCSGGDLSTALEAPTPRRL